MHLHALEENKGLHENRASGEKQFDLLCNAIHAVRNGENPTICEIEVQKYIYMTREDRQACNPLSAENAVLACVRNGESEKILDVVESAIKSTPMVVLSENQHRSLLYYTVALATLASRAAIEGGMIPAETIVLNNLYLGRADQCKTCFDVAMLAVGLLVDLTRRTADSKKIKRYSKTVAKTLDYIYCHINYRITTSELAEHVGKNPSYLTTLFKREVGETIQEFITRKRIEQAQLMLRFSDLPVNEISCMLSFNSPSYFGHKFRRQTGLSPTEFRSGLSHPPKPRPKTG